MLKAHSTRVAVVGVGNVGATFAYALLLSGLVSEIVLIDAHRDKAEGEAMDLNHTIPFAHPTQIWAGDYTDCSGAAVTVLAAGARRQPGQTRLDCIQSNAALWRDIVPKISKNNPDGILLVATNPVDVLTYAAWKLSRLPPQRVLGSGTILDTARFRYLLSSHFGVDAHSVHASIIGEHGDSEVPVWSLANIAGMRLPEFCQANDIAYEPEAMEKIFLQTRDAAYRIVELKGATYYAVAAGLMRITEAILRNQHTILSVSSLISNYHGISDVCLSLPTVVGRDGIETVVRLDLNDNEVAQLRHSAEILLGTIQKLNLD